DGIRDDLVTGVQTCALPIFPDGPKWVHFAWLGESFCIRDFLGGRERRQEPGLTATDVWRAARRGLPATRQYRVPVTDVERWRERSEERRVGKECRREVAGDR